MHRLKVSKKLIIRKKDVSNLDRAYKVIYKKLDLFDTKVYKDIYDEKGYSYALTFISNGGIKDLKEKNNVDKCDSTANDLIIHINKPNGEDEVIYPDPDKIEHIHTEVEVNDNDFKVKCNCKYYKNNKDKYCKHILALLIYKTGFSNIKPMIKLYEEYKRDLLSKKEYVINYINNHKRYYKKIDPCSISNVCGDIHNRIESIDKSIERSISNKSEYNIFLCLEGFIKSYYEFINDLEELLNRIDYQEVRNTLDSFKPKNDKRSGSGLAVVLGVFNGLYDYATSEDKKKNNSGYTEEELDSYGLSSSEKEEVYEGDFEPWDFEDDDTYDRADDRDEH